MGQPSSPGSRMGPKKIAPGLFFLIERRDADRRGAATDLVFVRAYEFGDGAVEPPGVYRSGDEQRCLLA